MSERQVFPAIDKLESNNCKLIKNGRVSRLPVEGLCGRFSGALS